MNKLAVQTLLTSMLALGIASTPNPALAGETEVTNKDSASQQQNMQDNLEDDLPLENPRIVVPENLQEMPDVHVVEPEEDQSQTDGDGETERTAQELSDLERELQMESADRGIELLDRTDRVMELSRRPLTYIQDNVPFLTRRNIIFFGRLELDGAYYSSGALEDDSGFSIRRFRVGLAGEVKFWEGWNYKIELDLTDGENTLSDTYLSWRSNRWGTIRLGNQKVAQTLSGQTSSLSIPFMERPLPVLAFTLQRRLGIGWDTHLRKMGANITLFSRDPNKGVGSQGWAARGYFNPTRERFHVIHVGGSYMQLSSDDDARLRARPESHVTDIRLVDTGVYPEVGSSQAIGLELAGARGPVTIRSEFYRTEWTRSGDDNPRFKGWYAEGSWFLTGEKAHYRDGKFIRPNVHGNRGAVEIAVRLSSIDLNDQDVFGGTQQNIALGVNWYSRTHWRFMGNLIKVKAKDGPYGDQDPWIIQFRAQYYF